MRKLLALLICGISFAQPQKIDTAKINQEIKQAVIVVEKEEAKEPILDEKIAAAEAKLRKMDTKLMSVIKILHKKYNTPKKKEIIKNNDATIKQEFEMLYGEDYSEFEVEVVERTWIGKIFHKLPFKFKKYKIVDGEKVYLVN